MGKTINANATKQEKEFFENSDSLSLYPAMDHRIPRIYVLTAFAVIDRELL